MDPAAGAEPVGAREEIRLENRLQHQLQGRLDHPVADRADPQAAALAVPGFGISRSRDGSGEKLRSFSESRSAPRNSPTPRAWMDAAEWPSTRRSSRPCCPHPDPCNQQERGIGDKVEQVVNRR